MKRLEIIKNSNDGFEIADKDLELRGPGDFLGERQHGLPPFKIADIFADKEVLELAGKEAQLLLKSDPQLKRKENAKLKQEIIEFSNKLNKE